MTAKSTGLVHVPYDRNMMSFGDMVEEAVQVEGNQLVKDELADELVGIPFLITKATFRKGVPDPANKGRFFAYVSIEAVIADETFLARRKIDLSDRPFMPGDHIVLNDGSTGLYRQVVAVLESQGYITLPDGPVAGTKGQTRYDAPPSEWPDVTVGYAEMGEVGSKEEGFLGYEVDVRIFAPRGLRLSTYQSEFGDAKTRYLA